MVKGLYTVCVCICEMAAVCMIPQNVFLKRVSPKVTDTPKHVQKKGITKSNLHIHGVTHIQI